jgi:hypothetical protein
MARTKTNKSAAIRQVFQENPTASVSQVVETLAGQKIKVSPQLVSNVKSRGEAKPKRRKGRPPKATLSVNQLMAAAEFVKAIGGLDRAATALETLNRLR